MTQDGPSLADVGPDALLDLLHALERELTAVGVPFDENLGAGIEDSIVRARLDRVGLTAPDELVVWFGWRNGIITPQGQLGASVLPCIAPATLDWACAAYESGRSYTEPLWSFADGWFPLEQHGHSVCVDTRRDPDLAPVVRRADEEFPLGETRARRQVVSLCTPVSWWIDGIRDGALEWLPSSLSWKTHFARLSTVQVESGIFS